METTFQAGTTFWAGTSALSNNRILVGHYIGSIEFHCNGFDMQLVYLYYWLFL